MAGQSKLFSDSMKAAADLSSYQYHFVYVSAARTVNVAGDNGAVYGILQNDPDAAGKPAEVMVYGISNVIAGDTVTYGNRLGSDASGHAIPVATDHDYSAAIARESGVANDIISVLLTPGCMFGTG